jgi:hypothetical protein
MYGLHPNVSSWASAFIPSAASLLLERNTLVVVPCHAWIVGVAWLALITVLLSLCGLQIFQHRVVKSFTCLEASRANPRPIPTEAGISSRPRCGQVGWSAGAHSRSASTPFQIHPLDRTHSKVWQCLLGATGRYRCSVVACQAGPSEPGGDHFAGLRIHVSQSTRE